MTDVDPDVFFKELLAQDPVSGAASTPRALADGTFVLAKPLMFHWTVIRGEIGDLVTYFDRWCFADEDLALKALHSFPEEPADSFDPPGWHRHPNSGRRRPGGDPTKEYVGH